MKSVSAQHLPGAKSSVVTPQTEEDSSYIYYSYFNGNCYESGWRTAQLQQTPDWPESAPYPPLSPRQALATAWTGLSKFMFDAKHWELMNISLVHCEKLKWVYHVKFYPPLADAKPPDPEPKGNIEVIVLMDGTAIMPQIIPDVLPDDLPRGPSNEKIPLESANAPTRFVYLLQQEPMTRLSASASIPPQFGWRLLAETFNGVSGPPAPDSLFRSLQEPRLHDWVSRLPAGSSIHGGFWLGLLVISTSDKRLLPNPLESEIDEFAHFCQSKHVDASLVMSGG